MEETLRRADAHVPDAYARPITDEVRTDGQPSAHVPRSGVARGSRGGARTSCYKWADSGERQNPVCARRATKSPFCMLWPMFSLLDRRELIAVRAVDPLQGCNHSSPAPDYVVCPSGVLRDQMSLPGRAGGIPM